MPALQKHEVVRTIAAVRRRSGTRGHDLTKSQLCIFPGGRHNVPSLIVNGVVAQRDKQPYIQIGNEDGKLAQLTMAEARNFAMDILQMCARTEADAMIVQFFEKNDFPEGAAGQLLYDFRDFRAKLDDEKIETSRSDPDTGEKV
jgi:hypothetical protein